MAISKAFQEWAEGSAEEFDYKAGNALKTFGVPITEYSGSDYDKPDPSWRTLVKFLGGEDAIDADFDGQDNFTVRDKNSGTEVVSNGAKHALADMVFALHGNPPE